MLGRLAAAFGKNMRSRQLVLIVGFGFLLLCASSSPAYAQSAAGAGYPAPCLASTVPEAESDKAHAFYKAGKAQYDDANYDAAIAQFREAYKRDCSKHDLLIIISRSYELKHDRAEAIRALELYLEREKPAPEEATHRTRIANLKKELAAQPPPPPPVAPAEVREHTAPPWIAVVVGGVGIVTGTILLVTAPTLPPGCNESAGRCDIVPVVAPGPPTVPPTPPPATTDAQKAELKRNQSKAELSVGMRTVGTVAIIAGAGVLAGGLLWHVLEPTGPAPMKGAVKPRVLPEVGPGYAGMSLGGTF